MTQRIKLLLTLLLSMVSMSGFSSNPDDGDVRRPSEKLKVIVNGVSFNMVKVSGGTFKMGATSEQGSDCRSDEKPVHQVTLSDYYIGETEVTQELWQAVMGSNPSKFSGSGKLPVEKVSWNDCQTFITKLNALTGKQFRLPTEAEWEFAARGGNLSKGYKYSGSNDISIVAWYSGNSDHKTHKVGTKAPNELGIYDMSGNVWEWCQDYWYDSYSSSAQTDRSHRVFRGGSWYNYAGCSRVSFRGDAAPDYDSKGDCGLRLAQTDNKETKNNDKFTVTVKDKSFNMVNVSGGTFQMGATSDLKSVVERAQKYGANWTEAQWKDAFKTVLKALKPTLVAIKDLEKKAENASEDEKLKIATEFRDIIMESKDACDQFEAFVRAADATEIGKKLSGDKEFEKELEKELDLGEGFFDGL